MNTIEKQLDYLKGIKFEIDIERYDPSPFIFTVFHYLEGPRLETETGYGFSDQVSVIKNKVAYRMARASELAEIGKKHSEYIEKTSIKNLEAFFKKSMDVYHGTDALVAKLTEINNKEFIHDLPEILETISNILMYTTTTPYFLLGGLEAGIVDAEKHALVLETCEKLRGDSKYMKIQELFLPKLADALHEKHGYDKDSVMQIGYFELLEYIKTGELTIDDEMKNRAKSSAFILDPVSKDRHHFIYDESIIEYMTKTYIEVDGDGVTQLTGSIAQKGYAKGTVKIINAPSDIEKMEEGDIILSRNTNPSIMPAIIKCSGIVTDEGGIACHAAIVSRELGKPCIIGTKIATKVLKDGDQVELDADNGIVHIITS